jgi:hypothetical protein
MVSAAYVHSVEVYVTVERETSDGQVIVTVSFAHVERWLVNHCCH